MIIFYTEKKLTFRQLLLCRREVRRWEGGGAGWREGGYGKGTVGQNFEGRNDEDNESESIDKKQDDKDSADDGDDGWDEEGGQGRVGKGPRTEKSTMVGDRTATAARGGRDLYVTIIIINKFGLRIW